MLGNHCFPGLFSCGVFQELTCDATDIRDRAVIGDGDATMYGSAVPSSEAKSQVK
jgi:hypothetical protein